MTHQALARKYRPRRFSEVETQEHVSDTLKRAVSGGRVGHAYLFCGPRGVGKTTLARVLAMSLNCPQRTAEGEPCGACDSCERIWGGHTALDVIEIDAASNRGVDDARELRERAMYAPSEDGHYKIYIVDEAHMLTREAWNALLKILEEPPPRVLFIFATTEPQKIQQSAAPILSRCQRFDFRRIGVSDIMSRLGEVLEREGTSAPEEALRTIARRAEGGMRDALSLLDQVIALTGGDVSQDAVRRVLGLVDEERYLELLGILRERRHAEVFSFLEALLDDGYDMVEFYHGWVDTLRMLLRARLGGAPPDLREDLMEPFREAASAFAPADLVRMLSLSSDLESTGSLRRSSQPRLVLEMLLLRLSYLDHALEIESLIRGLGGAPIPGSTEAGSAAERPIPASEATPRLEVARRSVPASGPAGLGERAPQTPRAPAPAPPEAPPSPAAATAATAAPRQPAESVPTSAATLVQSWERMIAQGRGVMPGLGPFLRAASVREDPPGTVRVSLPPGPARERLEDASVRRSLGDALSDVAGRPLELVLADDAGIGAAAPAEPPRVTQDTVREGRLQELLDREPLMERAVQELDLELLE